MKRIMSVFFVCLVLMVSGIVFAQHENSKIENVIGEEYAHHLSAQSNSWMDHYAVYVAVFNSSRYYYLRDLCFYVDYYFRGYYRGRGNFSFYGSVIPPYGNRTFRLANPTWAVPYDYYRYGFTYRKTRH